MPGESDWFASGLSFGGREDRAQAYDEATFRYLLTIERMRAERSHRSFLLLLVSMRSQPGASRQIPGTIADSIFANLRDSVRDVDFLGWLRQDRVAAAVLPQGADSIAADVVGTVGHRVTEVLDAVAPRLHVRVLQLQPARKR